MELKEMEGDGEEGKGWHTFPVAHLSSNLFFRICDSFFFFFLCVICRRTNGVRTQARERWKP